MDMRVIAEEIKKSKVRGSDVDLIKLYFEIFTDTLESVSNENRISLLSHKARVVVGLDYSVSMYENYLCDRVQGLINILAPIGFMLGVDRKIDLFTFDTSFVNRPYITGRNFSSYVDNVIKPNKNKMGGTEYYPFLNKVYDKYFNTSGKSLMSRVGNYGIKLLHGADEPVIVLIVTDGICLSTFKSSHIITKNINEQIMIQFIDIDEFNHTKIKDYVESLMQDVRNVSYLYLKSLKDILYGALYIDILDKYAKWLISCGYR